MAAGLFEGAGPRVRTIPASAPFLDTLVHAVLAAIPRDDPFALADVIIFLPNRRAGAGLVEAFARKLGGAALLPAIRALGDFDDDPDVWGPEPIALDVPPDILPLQRRFELAALVRALNAAEGGVNDPVRALAWADELCRLMDGAATVGGVDWSKLDTLVTERDLALHWRRSVAFLKIVAQYWPQRLADEGKCDPAQRRAILLERLAEAWTTAPPGKPVIIAGSTGSVSATRTLMRAVAHLPQGCVVLPGLDTELDDKAWSHIDAQHPQHALADTLATLGVDRRDVTSLVTHETPAAVARRRLISEALVPADATADWRARLAELGGDDPLRVGAQGLTVLEARNEDEEALVIALTLREVAETAERTAALVTPDAGLARRVASKLARWDIVPQTTIGAPLAESTHGVLVRLLADLFVDDGEPIALLALLRHPLVLLGLDAQTKAAAIDALERDMVRGPRRWRDLAGLRALVGDRNALPLVDALVDAFGPLAAAKAGELNLARLAEALADCAERLAAGDGESGARRLWTGPLGEAAAGVLRDMGECGADLGALDARDAPRALALLLAAREVPPPRGGHPRLSILGPLEARLQRRDVMILGGLVEGQWPSPPPEDAFLSRPMRADLGLPDPDVRVGLAAHDFAQLANAARVVMTWPAMREGAPTVASRWLWRLKTLARASGDEHLLAPDAATDPRAWAHAIDKPAAMMRLKPPAPRPPASARPKSISFSRVETLIRDPYAIYADRVLGLRALDPPGDDLGHNHRGTAIHDALEAFADGEDPAVLLQLMDAHLAKAGFDAARRRLERTRLGPVAVALAAWSAERRAAGFASAFEVEALLDIGDGHTLRGRADRIDVRPGRVAEVIDYKTGTASTNDEVASGLAPQLTLEAAALARGAFAVKPEKSVPAMPADTLIYWKIGGARGGPRAVEIKGKRIGDVAEEAFAALKALLARYDDPSQAYLCKPRVQFLKPWDDYDHFARRAEWADAEGEE